MQRERISFLRLPVSTFKITNKPPFNPLHDTFHAERSGSMMRLITMWCMRRSQGNIVQKIGNGRRITDTAPICRWMKLLCINFGKVFFAGPWRLISVTREYRWPNLSSGLTVKTGVRYVGTINVSQWKAHGGVFSINENLSESPQMTTQFPLLIAPSSLRQTPQAHRGKTRVHGVRTKISHRRKKATRIDQCPLPLVSTGHGKVCRSLVRVKNCPALIR